MVDDVWGIMKPTFQDMRSALQAQRMKVSFDTYDLTCDELTRRILKKTGKKWLTIGERSGIISNVAANSNDTIMTT